MQERCVLITTQWNAGIVVCLLAVSLTGITAGKKGIREDVARETTANDGVVGSGGQELLSLRSWNSGVKSEKVFGLYEKKSRPLIYEWKRVKEMQNRRHMSLKDHQVFLLVVQAFSVDKNWSPVIYRNPPRLKQKVRNRSKKSGENGAVKTHKMPETANRYDYMKPYYDTKHTGTKRRLLAVVSSRRGAYPKHKYEERAGVPKPIKGDKSVNSSVENATDFQILTRRRWRHRSEDAMWGLACTSFIIILLVWAVWFSGMCKGKKEEFIHVEYSTAIQHMTVREMLKNRAQHLPIFRHIKAFRKKKQDDVIPLLEVTEESEEEDKLFDQKWESIEGES